MKIQISEETYELLVKAGGYVIVPRPDTVVFKVIFAFRFR
jgi:hypothetical protein